MAYRSVLRPSSPVCAKASPRRPCYTLDRSAFVPCPEMNPGAKASGDAPEPRIVSREQTRFYDQILSVFRINRSCKPANPAFTMSENFSKPAYRFQSRVSVVTANLSAKSSELWWSRSGSNRRPQACKARALPTELRPRFEEFEECPVRGMLVGPGRVERPTSRLSGVRSNHLSYEPATRGKPGRIRAGHDGKEGKRRGRPGRYVQDRR